MARIIVWIHPEIPESATTRPALTVDLGSFLVEQLITLLRERQHTVKRLKQSVTGDQKLKQHIAIVRPLRHPPSLRVDLQRLMDQRGLIQALSRFARIFVNSFSIESCFACLLRSLCSQTITPGTGCLLCPARPRWPGGIHTQCTACSGSEGLVIFTSTYTQSPHPRRGSRIAPSRRRG